MYSKEQEQWRNLRHSVALYPLRGRGSLACLEGVRTAGRGTQHPHVWNVIMQTLGKARVVLRDCFELCATTEIPTPPSRNSIRECDDLPWMGDSNRLSSVILL